MSNQVKSPMSAAQVLEMLAECFMEHVDDLAVERTRDSIAGWDSMGALMLIAELDERFGLELSADDSRAMTRVSHVFDFLSRRDLLRA